MVLKVTHKQLNDLLKEYYTKKLSLFIYGAFGIGKSFCVRDTAKEIAESKAKTFVEWNRLDKETKQKVFEYPEKYFVLIDERLSEYDSSDIKGLPNFKDGQETLEWKIPKWAKFITLENSDGVVFFDEINLATPLVISSVYKIIYDRIVNDSPINKNWLVVGAGNREEDRAFTHTLPAPVRDRGGEVELINASIEDWTDWASKNNIDSRILGFVNFKPSSLSSVDFDSNQKFTTTRGWERLSKLIDGNTKKMSKSQEVLICSAIGEGIAREFIAFWKIQEKLNLEEVIKKPSKIEEIEEISIKYFLVSVLAEKYKNKKVDFAKIVEVSKVLDKIGNAEFVALLWRICINSCKQFEKDFLNTKDEIVTKYSELYIN
jgi:hypothetical protein